MQRPLKTNYPAKPGFVMMVVLILMIFFAAIAQRLSQQLLLASALTNGYSHQEQAKLLALSGISIALTNLFCSEMLEETRDVNSKKKPGSVTPENQLAAFYKNILQDFNLWQELSLQKTIDGIDGKISICLMCEDGKINVNKLLDTKNKRINPDYLALLDAVEVKEQNVEAQKLTTILKAFFDQRRWKPIEDPTELDFGLWFKRFYLPISPKVKSDNPLAKNESPAATKKSKIALTDLFTVIGGKDGINPLLLSAGLCQVLGYGTPSYLDAKSQTALWEKLKTKISFEMGQDWQKHFASINELLETACPREQSAQKSTNQTNKLQKIQKLLNNEVEPKFLSVLSCGEFKKNKYTVLAIVERQSIKNRANLSWGKRQNMLVPPGYNIVKIYFGIDEF